MTTDETAKKYILEILAEHVGAEKKLTRNRLLRRLNDLMASWSWKQEAVTKITDRRMRTLIAELRTTPKGRWIVASQRDGGGYFIAKDMAEAREYIAPDYSRCYTKLKGLSKQMKLIGLEISPQMELEI